LTIAVVFTSFFAIIVAWCKLFDNLVSHAQSTRFFQPSRRVPVNDEGESIKVIFGKIGG
jgi:hypothetical protein